jgi:hypothetical protein
LEGEAEFNFTSLHQTSQKRSKMPNPPSYDNDLLTRLNRLKQSSLTSLDTGYFSVFLSPPQTPLDLARLKANDLQTKHPEA